jgi:hypothetical protein
MLCLCAALATSAYAIGFSVLDRSLVMLIGLAPSAFFLRLSRLEAIGDSDQLVVRNTLTTRRLPRSRIRAFEVQEATPVNEEIRAMLADGTRVALKVTYRTTLGALSDAAFARDLSALNSWLRSPI